MSRVAIFIDGDNVSATHAERIVALGQTLGQVDILRAYADATNGSGWNTVPGVRLMHAGSGKNAADLLLSIDAIELALTQDIATFLLASSDRDFTHVATRLRFHGRTVVGVGEDKATEAFQRACTRFEFLAVNRSISVTPRPRSPGPSCSRIDRAILSVIEAAENKTGDGVTLCHLGNRLKNIHGIDRNALPGSTLKSYLAGKPNYYELYPYDQPVAVRLRASPEQA